MPKREALNLAAHNLLRRTAQRLHLDVVRADFNSPIVDTRALPTELWDRPAALHGLELDLERQMELIEGELRQFIDELRLPVSPPAPGESFRLHLDNPWYGPMDAHLLYAFVRRNRPRRILELGSGFSTLFIEHALAADRSAGRGGHVVVDPYPSPLVNTVQPAVKLHRCSAAEAPQGLFSELGAGDVLFVDTSHTIRPGGEVVRLVLEVLPLLAPGVLVHFHDIFVPFAYPRVFYERYNVHWQEQYLLQAFLAYNPNFTVLCSNHALWRLQRERLRGLFPGLRDGMQPGGFWFVRDA